MNNKPRNADMNYKFLYHILIGNSHTPEQLLRILCDLSIIDNES